MISKCHSEVKIMENMGYKLISPEYEINEFIKTNENANEILSAIMPQLVKFFPGSEFSLELCDELEWTTERKLLVNISANEEMVFNKILDDFNAIYESIDSLIEDIFCPIVLFPDLGNEKYDRFSNSSPINLIANTAYFNSDFDKNMQREMSLRDIPKSQQEKEIIDYCNIHENVDLSDLIFDLQLDLFDVDEILDELSQKGIELNVNY